ncbi:MAG: RecX family transcriptional regulator [Nitrospirae bacterium]|nr:RecX family transcriptional regulator [Nitrospirota bacterium]
MKDSQNKIKQYALKLLSYRARSEKELKERLKNKGFPENDIFTVTEHLKELGFINDNLLAESLKRDASERKLLSSDGIKKYLLQKGIPKNVIKSVCNGNDNEDLDNAIKYLLKKFRKSGFYPDEKTKKKLYNQLLRRGYSPDIIFKAFNKIKKEE